MDTYKKKAIPKAIREQLWIQKVGRKFETKCKTTWCRNKINVFDFQAGHDVPECKGGSTEISNLQPICSRCNLSMGSQHTFKEWCKKGKQDSKWIQFIKSIRMLWTSSDTKESGTKSRQKLTNPSVKPPK
jgi:5-methylcytosine-specific restriction endonuclease McrA